MKIKMYSAKQRPSYMKGSGSFLTIWAYCIEYGYSNCPKETLRKLYLSNEVYMLDNWLKIVKREHIRSWCYYEDLTFMD